MNTTVKTYSANGYHEITTALRFKIKETDRQFDHVSATDILSNSEIRNFLVNALKLRIDACTTQLFRNYNNVVSVSENQILFKLEKANKVHSYNLPSIKAMQDGIQWLEDFSGKLDAPQGMWEQIGKSLYWVEKPSTEWTIVDGKNVRISFGDVVSVVWELALYQMCKVTLLHR